MLDGEEGGGGGDMISKPRRHYFIMGTYYKVSQHGMWVENCHNVNTQNVNLSEPAMQIDYVLFS